MTESKRIADQLHRAYAGGAWHGPALHELLRDVTARQAAARPLRSAHTIWELVLHITAWKGAVLRRMQGEGTSLSAAKNFPPMPPATAANWEKTLAMLRAAQRELHRAVSALPESRLRKIVPGKRYSLYFMLHGLVQHDLYHAGQIALLKKPRRRKAGILSSWRASPRAAFRPAPSIWRSPGGSWPKGRRRRRASK